MSAPHSRDRAQRARNYEKFPHIPAGPRSACIEGWKAIAATLGSTGARVLAVDTYTGIDRSHLATLLRALDADLSIWSGDAFKHPDDIDRMVRPYVTDDPVFGRVADLALTDFFDEARRRELRDRIRSCNGRVVVYGPGASLLAPSNVLVYADMPRREEVLRQRSNETSNLGTSNLNQDASLRYKRSFFVDWRVCDAHRREALRRADYVLDVASGVPKMLEARTFLAALRRVAERPFRVVPYFDPAPWGGQWLADICDLEREAPNYGWAFDCVPEENSILLGFDEHRFESPAIDLVQQASGPLLGPEILERFGDEFPIRFDFLDTMEGGNLSLQVHPTTTYIRDTFGMSYTQDESYYLVDAAAGASVYLGLKEHADPEQMMADLREGERGRARFPDERYVNRWPARPHDHFLIPAGTIHCSGANSVVLEISATPFIFTFKLWDWGRLGLDGKPRPIHLDHGERCIKWDRDTEFVETNLMDRTEELGRGEGWIEERTGLHELQFIETRRHWFTAPVPHHTRDTVNVLNLVEGEQALVESPTDNFEPIVVHYAETFIVPASVGSYTIRPCGGEHPATCATIKAFVR